MTLESFLTDDDSGLKSISITFIPELLGNEAGECGDIGIALEITLSVASLEKFISSEAGYALTPLFMNLIMSGQTGCGVEVKPSPEKMKRDTLRSLMNLLESLLENLEK